MVIMHILNLYTHINLHFFCKKTNIQFLPFTARDTVPAMVQIELLSMHLFCNIKLCVTFIFILSSQIIKDKYNMLHYSENIIIDYDLFIM